MKRMLNHDQIQMPTQVHKRTVFQGSPMILRIHGLGVAVQTRGPFLSGNASGRTT